MQQRPENFKTERVPFKSILPLAELIGLSFGTALLNSKKVMTEYLKLTQKFGNEFEVLLNIEKEKLETVAQQKIVELILRNRAAQIEVTPGYDGVYGKPKI